MIKNSETLPSDSKNKIVILFVGVLLIVGAGLLIFLWPGREEVIIQPVEEKTNQEEKKEVSEYEGWGMYTNKKFGYSFKYPKEWNADENKYNRNDALFGMNATGESGVGGVNVREFSGNIQDYLVWEERNVSDIKFSNAQNIVLDNGLTAMSVEYADVVSGRVYLLKKGNYIYKLFLNSVVTEDLELFGKLARSFSVKENQVNVTKDAKGEFTLSSIVSVNLPEKWQILSTEDNSQFTNYTIFDEKNTFNIIVVKLDEWLKGPNPEEGYVIPHDQRAEALSVLKNIYDHEKITAEDKKLFVGNSGEFLGYNSNQREVLSYFASADNSFRGISFYNTVGQGPGVYPIYHISLYYPDQGLLITGYYSELYNFKELKLINEPFVNLKEFSGIKNLDSTAHEQFKKLVGSTPRQDLSFGEVLNTMDGVFKSLR